MKNTFKAQYESRESGEMPKSKKYKIHTSTGARRKIEDIHEKRKLKDLIGD